MEKTKRYLSSYKTTITLLLIYAVAMAIATFVEKDHGTEIAKKWVYYSPAFFLLQFLLVLNFFAAWNRYGYVKQKRWALLTVHLAFVVILGGALTTFLFGKEGTVHIREGNRTDEMIVRTSDGVSVEKLPFVLELTDFRLNRYPGSASPSSYESDLLVHVDGKMQEAKIFMNNVLDVKGYRFFQASYDQDELGTILSVNQDVAGRTITYSGYFLLFCGFVLVFFTKNSRFRRLVRQLKSLREESKHLALVLILLIGTTALQAQTTENRQSAMIPPEHAAQFAALPVQSGGRIMPVHTLSSEIVRKVYKERKMGQFYPEQFLLSFLAEPRIWIHEPFIAIDNSEISSLYGLPKDYASYVQFFDKNGHYKLLHQMQIIYGKSPAERSATDKNMMKLDERVNIVFQLLDYSLLRIYPDPNDDTHTWYPPNVNPSIFPKEDSLFVTDSFRNYLVEVSNSLQSGDWSKPDQLLTEIKKIQLKNDIGAHINSGKVKTEISYNQLRIFDRCKLSYFILGGLLLVLAFMQLLKKRKWADVTIKILSIVILCAFLVHAFGMGMRWYIGGYAPWSNSYETMVYVAWATVLAGIIFGRKSTITMALATLFGGIILFVSGLNWMDPQIGTLVPVLKSPWLMFHVAIIVAAYGFFGIGFLLGIVNLSLTAFAKKSELIRFRMKELSITNNMALLVGLALMSIGTFLGAIWANESWGRYWGWDPKETWALITMIVYSIVTHIHLVKKRDNLWLFNLLSVLAFASVLMTFFGVNYLLSGMHSYGVTDGVSAVFIYIVLAFVAIGILGVLSYRKRRYES
ncbi:MAG: Cytochrome c biogenesis protein CcsA [Bacteroidetes bacterium ADurb.Bin174]|jgi:cytochrome c-type biogenesis protein CcsB|nr:MAG: Cytochrome c biogenesis protein CcsA [Bacteroidetes bacterium ADurb.Bin174]